MLFYDSIQAELPNFLEENNLFPDYKLADRKGSHGYKQRLREELKKLDTKVSKSTSPRNEQHQPEKSNPNRYSSFDAIDDIPSPSPELLDGIINLEEYFQTVGDTDGSRIDSVFLTPLYELSLNIRKLLREHNRKLPDQKFELN